MLDKYLYLICNPLKIKTIINNIFIVVVVELQAAHPFRSISLLCNLPNRTL